MLKLFLYLINYIGIIVGLITATYHVFKPQVPAHGLPAYMNQALLNEISIKNKQKIFRERIKQLVIFSICFVALACIIFNFVH